MIVCVCVSADEQKITLNTLSEANSPIEMRKTAWKSSKNKKYTVIKFHKFMVA